MKGLEGIKERILKNAQDDADKVLEQANQEAVEDVAKIEKETQKKLEKLEKDNAQKIEQTKERMLSVAQLEMRKEVLAAKQVMISKAFDRALAQANNMEEVQYKALLCAMLMNAVSTGKEAVVFSKQDSHNVGQALVDQVNKQLTASGKLGELMLAEPQTGFCGGFILSDKGCEINNSFEAIFRMTRDEIEPEVANILFA
jgi:V/A-type H+-transporting ATPase subunit E